MAYTPITNAQVDPDSPVTAELMSALRDNPIAIANGDAGAPRISDAALSSTVTAAGRTWVANRISGVNAGDIGSVIFARVTVVGDLPVVSYGGTIAGSSLRPSNASGSLLGTARSGTWRCLGATVGGGSSNAVENTTLFIRIS